MKIKITNLSWSFCLFNLICLGRDLSIKTLRHETGHYLQWKQSGLFYYLGVCIVSTFRWWVDVLLHRKWTGKRRTEWYYGSWPENNANARGAVNADILPAWQATLKHEKNAAIIELLTRYIEAVEKGL